MKHKAVLEGMNDGLLSFVQCGDKNPYFDLPKEMNPFLGYTVLTYFYLWNW